MTRITSSWAELERLPVGSIVLDPDGDAWQRGEDGWTCTDRSSNTVDQPTDSLIAILAPLTILHVPGEPAPADVIDREAIDVAIGGVLFNASNYPGPARPYLWGRDIGPLRRKVVDAVLAILPGKTTAQVRAETLRDAADALAKRNFLLPRGHAPMPVLVDYLRTLTDEEGSRG